MTIHAQEKDLERFGDQYKGGEIVTDPFQENRLDTVFLMKPPRFKTNYDRRYYLWLRKKTFKAYPYAVLAKEKLDSLNLTINTIDSSRKRRRYIKKKQKFFEEQFTEDIKKLTRTEGRILIKLIHRLTGATVNEHVQEKRGKFKAFWYRFSASVFKIDLDLTYQPESVMEDYIVEIILQQAFLNDRLLAYPSVLPSGKTQLPFRVIHIEKKK